MPRCDALRSTVALTLPTTSPVYQTGRLLDRAAVLRTALAEVVGRSRALVQRGRDRRLSSNIRAAASDRWRVR
jgi:hypothetical protein